jgi:hypothetical protein
LADCTACSILQLADVERWKKKKDAQDVLGKQYKKRRTEKKVKIK